MNNEQGYMMDNVVWRLSLIPFTKVLDSCGIKYPPVRSNNKIMMMCPFHEESQPSFYITLDNNIAWCFGCNKRFDPISFIMKYEKCRFVPALEKLVKIGGLQVSYKELKSIGNRYATAWGNPKEFQKLLDKRNQRAWNRLVLKVAAKFTEHYRVIPGWQDFYTTYIEHLWREFDVITGRKVYTRETIDQVKDWYRKAVRFINQNSNHWSGLAELQREVFFHRVGQGMELLRR